MLKLPNTQHTPDILDCIANLSTDEVFTPPIVCNRILDLLPPEVWTNPTLKFLDPACKSGVFLREIAKRLLEGLTEAMPDEDQRREHIYKNMLYGVAITEITALMTRRTLYYTKDATSEKAVVCFDHPDGNVWFKRSEHSFKNGRCTICGANQEQLDRSTNLENYAYGFIHEKDIFSMKFDVIIGNPPYQLQDGGHGASASPLYHKFVEQAFAMRPKYVSFIIPARWYAGGKGLDDFRNTMLHDKRIKVLVDHPDATDCFPPEADLSGGVCYFLWDAHHAGECEVVSMSGKDEVSRMKRHLAGAKGEENIFVRFNEAISILNKVQSKGEATLEEQVSSLKPFGFRTFFDDFERMTLKDGVSTPPQYILDSEEDYAKIYARGTQGWVKKELITVNTEWVNQYKVLISMAYGERNERPYFILGKPFVIEPNSCCTETYLVCGVYESETLAKHLAVYLKSKFLRFLVSLRKNTQHITKSRFAFVPALDMNEAWTDEKLYARYGLSPDEIAFIESMIKEMP